MAPGSSSLSLPPLAVQPGVGLSLPLRPGSLAQFAPVSETWLVGWVVARAVMGMDGQPDVVSFEPRPRRPDWWPRAGRGGRIAIIVVLLMCLGVIAVLALLVANRDHTIADLRTALRNARHQAPATAAGPALPADSGSAMFTLPDAALGSFSVVAVAVRARSGSDSGYLAVRARSACHSWPALWPARGHLRRPVRHRVRPGGRHRGPARRPHRGSPRGSSPPARSYLVSGSCCIGGRTARPLAASRGRWPVAGRRPSGPGHRAERAVTPSSQTGRRA